MGMRGLDTSTPILVLRGSLAEFQHTVLCVARSAGRLGIPVHATVMGVGEPATRSRYIHGRVRPPRGASDPQRLRQLLDLDLRAPTAVLVPIDDASAVFVDDHHGLLSQRFLTAGADRGLRRRLASKRELWEICQRFGIPAPASSFPESEHGLRELGERYGYPVVLKRSDPWLPTRDPGAPSVLIARTPGELLDGYRRMESPIKPHVIVQQYIPGGPETIWMFNGYFNRDAKCLSAFTGQKLRQRGAGTGPATLGICAWNERVGQVATALMRHVGYHGIVDMGFRYDQRDDTYKLLDVNPRLGSTFRLFTGAEGLDVVRAAYLDLTGQPVPASRASDGRKWLVEPYDIVAAAQLIARRQLTPKGWLRTLSGVEELAWWARDDPLPFLAMCASAPAQALRYRERTRCRQHQRRAMEIRSDPSWERVPLEQHG